MIWIYITWIVIAIISFLIGCELKQRQHQNIIDKALNLYKDYGELNRALYNKKMELDKCTKAQEDRTDDVESMEHYILVNENLKKENNTLIKKNKKYKNQVKQLKKHNQEIKLKNNQFELKKNKYKKEIDNLQRIIADKNHIIKEYENTTSFK